MRLSRPSPAMVVALIALAFAMTGTAIAAKSAFIITSGKQIKPGVITAANIKDGSITSAKLAKGAVTSTKLSANAVTTEKIAKDAVTETRIASGAVTGRGLGAGSVASTNLAPGAVTSGAIAADAVTSANLAAGSVTSRAAGGAVCADGSIAFGSGCHTTASWSAAAPIPSFPGGTFSLAAGVSGNPTAVGLVDEVWEVAPGKSDPSIGWHIHDAIVSLRGPALANVTSITATLAVVGVPSGSANSCSFNPQTTSSCTVAASSGGASIFAQGGAKMAWLFQIQVATATVAPAFTLTTAFVGGLQCDEGHTC